MSRIDRAAAAYVRGLAAERRRALTASDAGRFPYVVRDGRRLIDFSSNDYLGLAGHPSLITRAMDWTQRWGTGARASRLVSGNLDLHERLEAKIAAAKGSEAALLFNSGWQANAALIPALTDASLFGAPVTVFADRLVHASLYAGVRQAGADLVRYRHNDLDHLDRLIKTARTKAGAGFVPMIVTESVFSMDGDRADLAALIDLADRWEAVLFVDEAHATGVLGPNGMGLSGNHSGRIPLVMGTFGKALGSFGAYLACSAAVKDYLVNRCAGFIYTTALPPPVLGAVDAALELVPTLDAERDRLHANADRLRASLTRTGIDTGASSTQIVPAIIGSPANALACAGELEAAGILGVAMRPPTVAPNTARIRFSLSAAHREHEMARLLGAVETLARYAEARLDRAATA